LKLFFRFNSNTLPSLCQEPAYVFNVASVKFGQNSWSRTQDHSKWCVSPSSPQKAGVACFGGINNQLSQRSRGGETLCSSSLTAVVESLFAAVVTVNSCGSSSIAIPVAERAVLVTTNPVGMGTVAPLSAGAIVGIVMGVVLLLAVAIVVLIVMMRKRKQNRGLEEELLSNSQRSISLRSSARQPSPGPSTVARTSVFNVNQQ
jgi:hypothetical protein